MIARILRWLLLGQVLAILLVAALLMVVPPQPTANERAAFERLPRETILIVDQ